MAIRKLIDLIDRRNRVFIQTHNFPDTDAVATAFGLQAFLKHFEIESEIVFDGRLQRLSLRRMIKHLGIKLDHRENFTFKPEDQVIIVDGCKGNRNVTELAGTEIGVIDHHDFADPGKVPFYDIRSSLGACSTLIYSYFRELKIAIPRDVATALMIGIRIDTSHFTRNTSEKDLDAFSALFRGADTEFFTSVIRNNIQRSDLKYYKHVIENLKVKGFFGYCNFPHGCDQNLLGILSDFILGIDEVSFVAITAHNEDRIDISVRSEVPKCHSSRILHDVLDGIGTCGGHQEMAGGCFRIKEIGEKCENADQMLFTRFNEIIGTCMGKAGGKEDFALDSSSHALG